MRQPCGSEGCLWGGGCRGSIRKGPQNPRHCLQKVPSQASSAPHGKGLRASHKMPEPQFGPATDSLGSQDSAATLPIPGPALSSHPRVWSRKTDAANCTLCFTLCGCTCTNKVHTHPEGHVAVTHEEHTVRTRVHTQPNARLQGLVLYTDEHATSLTHTHSSSEDRECASRQATLPGRPESCGVGIQDWGEPSCGTRACEPLAWCLPFRKRWSHPPKRVSSPGTQRRGATGEPSNFTT